MGQGIASTTAIHIHSLLETDVEWGKREGNDTSSLLMTYSFFSLFA